MLELYLKRDVQLNTENSNKNHFVGIRIIQNEQKEKEDEKKK